MGFFALVKGSNEYPFPFFANKPKAAHWGTWMSGQEDVRPSLYPQSVSSKGWELGMLEIRIERPVSRMDRSFQQNALRSCNRGSMDQHLDEA